MLHILRVVHVRVRLLVIYTTRLYFLICQCSDLSLADFARVVCRRRAGCWCGCVQVVIVKSARGEKKNMASAMECKPKDIPSTELLSKSPVFTSEQVNNIKEHDDTGIPLQTPWTFWLDKLVFHVFVFLSLSFFSFPGGCLVVDLIGESFASLEQRWLQESLFSESSLFICRR